MYLDLWRILRKELSEYGSGLSTYDVIRKMDRLERETIARVNWDKNAPKALKHLRKIDSYNSGCYEDVEQM